MWEDDPVVHALVTYMSVRGCSWSLGHPSNPGLLFALKGKEFWFYGEDISNALHAAYRIEFEPSAIKTRFAMYLIDLYNKRQDATPRI